MLNPPENDFRRIAQQVPKSSASACVRYMVARSLMLNHSARYHLGFGVWLEDLVHSGVGEGRYTHTAAWGI